jgi:hypothetical protein
MLFLHHHLHSSFSYRYTYAMQALSHALILAPQNPFYVLQFAEIAYTAGDIPLAVKMYLVVVDMTDDEDAPIKSIPTDVALRAWYGVKLVRVMICLPLYLWFLTIVILSSAPAAYTKIHGYLLHQLHKRKHHKM